MLRVALPAGRPVFVPPSALVAAGTFIRYYGDLPPHPFRPDGFRLGQKGQRHEVVEKALSKNFAIYADVGVKRYPAASIVVKERLQTPVTSRHYREIARITGPTGDLIFRVFRLE
jgi:hypothetical protein